MALGIQSQASSDIYAETPREHIFANKTANHSEQTRQGLLGALYYYCAEISHPPLRLLIFAVHQLELPILTERLSPNACGDNHIAVMLGAFDLRHRIEYPVLIHTLGDDVAPEHLLMSRLIHRQPIFSQQITQEHTRVGLVCLHMFVVDAYRLLRHRR